jgi:hypothetical protein
MSILRGVPLVEHVIERVRDEMTGGGLSVAELAELSLNGKPLPPSLRRWLAFNTAWAEFDFQPTKLEQHMGPAFKVFEKLLPGDFYSMRASQSDSTWWFLYAGDADELGEYPIFLADIDDWYLVKIAYPGFDVFLAEYCTGAGRGWRADLSGKYQDDAALRRHAEMNFQGYWWCELYGKAADINGKESAWEGMPAQSWEEL